MSSINKASKKNVKPAIMMKKDRNFINTVGSKLLQIMSRNGQSYGKRDIKKVTFCREFFIISLYYDLTHNRMGWALGKAIK